MNKKVEFTKEKICAYNKVSREYFESIAIEAGIDGDDFIKNLISLRLNGYILSNTADRRILTYYCPRSTFFDWLLRRKRVVKWELVVKDILLNPPKMPKGTIRLYVPSEVE